MLAAAAMPGAAGAAPPAANAQPTGGVVVGGTAAISHGASNTLIQQSTSRAAIDWQSFNVGSQQSVTFQQPGATSTTLNRVVGPDPSAIAGKITANGQVVISNQAGVIFYKGSEVDTAGLIATSANITNPNFMSGKMIFDQAGSPNARVVNRGTITVREAGLVGLVAPSVANSGVINAKLGHVVLAGAQTHTVDLYGDGLLSIDVTGQVTQAPVGRNGRMATALVTNTGTILAEGGSIQLTAKAADGLVQTLVDAGGRISVGGGRIEIAGNGGSVQVDGRLLADGRGAAGVGGQITVNATDGVTVAGTARIAANGAAGGGTIALGTTLARAAGGPAVVAATTARRVSVQKGAVISADARSNGSGGKVTVLATDTTDHSGRITARGGAQSGNGGSVEVSGATLALDGAVDVSAAHGALGSILLDPIDIVIANAAASTVPVARTSPNVGFDASTANNPGTVTPASLQQLQGNVRVEATRNLTVNAAVALTGTGQNLTLEAGNNLTLNASVSTTGQLSLLAASPNSPSVNTAGAVTIAGAAAAAGALGVAITSGTGGIAIGGPVTTGGALTLATTGAITQPGGVVTAASLSSASGQSTSLNQANAVTQLLASSAGGDFSLASAAGLTVAGAVTAGAGRTLTLTSDAPQFAAGTAGPGSQGAGSLTAAGGTVVLQPYTAGTPFTIGAGSTVGASPPVTAATFVYGSTTAGDVSVVGSLAVPSAQTLSLVSGGAVAEAAGAAITANAVSGSAGANFSLGGSNQANQVGTLGNITAGGIMNYAGSTPVTLAGTISAPGQQIQIIDDQITFGAGALLNVSTNGTITSSNNNVFLSPFAAGDAQTIAGGQGIAGPALTVANVVAIGGYTSLATGGLVAPATVNVTGQLNLGTAAALFRATGAVGETGSGAIGASELTATVGRLSFAGPNAIGAIGGVTATGGVTVNTTTPLVVLGPVVDQTAVNLASAGNMALAGSVSAPSITLGAVGNILQTSGSLTGTTLTGSGTAVSLNGSNSITALGAFTSGGAFTLNDTQPLTITGAVTSGSAVTLSSTGGAVVEATGGSVSAPALAVSATGSVALTGGNTVASLGSGSAGAGNFRFLDLAPLTVAGTVSAPGNQIIIRDDNIAFGANGLLTVAGTVAAPGNQIIIRDDNIAFGANGLLTVGTAAVNSSAGPGFPAAVFLAPAGSGDAQTIGGRNGTTGAQPVVAPLVSLGSYNDSTAGTILAGSLAITGGLNLGAATVRVSATGLVSEPGAGAIAAATLTSGGNGLNAVGGSGTVALNGANAFASLGAYTSRNGFSLTNAAPLTVTGAVTDNTAVAISAAGALTLGGSLAAPSVTLNASGAIGQTGGTLTAGTLSGSAGGSAQFGGGVGSGGGVASVGTLNGFSVSGAGGVLALADSRALTVTGAVTAAEFALSAPSAITVTNATVSTAGVSVAQQGGAAPSGPGSYFLVTADPQSGGGQFNQTGSVSFVPLTAAEAGSVGPGGTATIRIQVPDNGTVQFSNLAAGRVNIVLATGQGGTSSGSLSVGNLLVLGQGGSAALTGSVGGQGGTAAAPLASIRPAIDVRYLFNGCVIGAATCSGAAVPTDTTVLYPYQQNIAPIVPASFLRPDLITLNLLTLSLSPNPNDPDLLLPNISSQDY